MQDRLCEFLWSPPSVPRSKKTLFSFLRTSADAADIDLRVCRSTLVDPSSSPLRWRGPFLHLLHPLVTGHRRTVGPAAANVTASRVGAERSNMVGGVCSQPDLLAQLQISLRQLAAPGWQQDVLTRAHWEAQFSILAHTPVEKHVVYPQL